LFRLRHHLQTSRLSGPFHLIKGSRIRLLQFAALSCLAVLTVIGSISVAGARARPASPVAHPSHARSIHLSSASETRPRGHAYRELVTFTTADILRKAFAAFYHIPLRDVGTVVTGSLHVAADPAHKGFWATGEFPPSRRVTRRLAIDFQDGGDIGIFRSGNDISWHMSGAGGEPFPCPARVPSGVLTAWGVAPSPLCANHARHARPAPPSIGLAAPNATAGTIAQVAESQVGVGDTPVSRSFASPDCDPYTALVGQRPGSAGCGVSARFGVRDQNEFWCADFAKWVWRRAGISSGLGTLNPGAASFYTWAREHGQRPRFGSDTPAVGDAVVFYPPWESTPAGGWADHVGIVAGVNSNGTVDLVNGDFGGDGVPITVERNNDISLASWAS
jgi:CHAP domain